MKNERMRDAINALQSCHYIQSYPITQCISSSPLYSHSLIAIAIFAFFSSSITNFPPCPPVPFLIGSVRPGHHQDTPESRARSCQGIII
jgi:hypothetical protein